MKLIIAEKPSVARDLAQALGIKPSGRGSFRGRDYIVTWAVGHLVTLAEPHQINPVWQKWRESDLPILPTHWPLSVLEGTAQQFEEIRQLMHAPEVSSVIAATDAGREGELIFRYIYEKAECRKPAERLWLSSLTPESIQEAFRLIRPLSAYDNLANNARGRSRSDWLVGLNFSRAYSLKQNDRWTVGRVQTPTLAMVVERTEAIQEFVPEAYFEIEARFATARKEEFRGIYFEAKTKDLAKGEAKRFAPGDSAVEAIVARARRGQARIKKRDDKQQKIPPPKLYDLTELQKDANRLFGFQAKYTLDLSQSLYESHKLLTYPRSDSRYLSSSVAATLPGIVAVIRQAYQDVDLRSDTGIRALGSAFVDDKKVSDHHAIIPTGKDPRSARMSVDEAKVFDLVAKRLLMAWQDDLIKSQSTVVTEILCDGLSDTYKSSGMIVLQEGWRALERRTRAADASALPFVREAEDVSVKKVESLRKETKPPPAFSDATLLNGMASAGSRLDDKELEGILREKGLGTPATRAATIETLITRKYVERRDKQLWATELGCALIHAVHPSVCSAALTGEWEAKLRRIEAGELTLDVFMREIEGYVKETVEMIRESQPARSIDRRNAESPRASRPKESFDAVARSGGESARDAVALFASPVSSLRDSLGASGEWESRASSSSTSGDLTASRVRTLTTDSHLNTHLDWQKDNPSNSTNANNQQPREARNQTNPSTNTRQGATSQLTANSQFTGSLKDALYTYFGHRQFREHQEQICHEIIEGSDLLLVMPTGAGKSLCYQLPAIVLDGCTIVISPLIALMDDQVQKLKSLGIAAGALHSGLSREQSRALCVDYQEGRLKLLYIAPERLGLSGFADFLARTPPSLIAIDEAHCISQWGHDFRPDYRMLAQRLLKLRPAPIVAMTATATPLVQKDIAIQLDLRNPSLHIHGFRRTNIAIEISEVSLPDRPQLTEQLLSNPGSRPAIVYAPTRKDTESVSQKLSGRVAAYHAGLSHEIRQQVQRDFQAGKLDVIVATVAFGMGIDKSDIRTVVHIALPSSVEAYYQEIGRAGRDGKPSRAILLHSYADHRTREFFVKKNYPDVKVLEKVMAKIPVGGILRSGIRSELDAQALDNALEKLWVHGAIDIDTNDEVKPVSKTWQRSYLNQQIHKEAEVGLMSNFAQNQQHCRMMLFLNHFGDLSDNRNGCGICDFCAPVTSLSKIFRAPNVIEQRAMFGILEILKIAHRPQSITKVFQALESNSLVTDRKVFDVLVDCLTRSGAVNSSQDSFEKDGQTISYRTLALAGQDMPTLDFDALLIVEPSQSEEKVRYRRGKGTKSKTATKTKVKKEKKVNKAEALNDPLSQKLRGWRLQMAKKERVPAYRIFSDKTLADIAHSRPRSLLMLSEIDGIGAVKLAKYGNDLINMLGGH